MTKMAVVKGRRDASSRRRLSGAGVTVRRRVQQVDATAAPAPTPPLLQRLLAACRRAFRGPGTVPAPDDVALIRGILGTYVLELNVAASICCLLLSSSQLQSHT